VRQKRQIFKTSLFPFDIGMLEETTTGGNYRWQENPFVKNFTLFLSDTGQALQTRAADELKRNFTL